MTGLPAFLVKRCGLTAEEIIERWGTEDDALRYAQFKAANSLRARFRRWVETTPTIWVRRGFLVAVAVGSVWGAWLYIH
jgi:hypothetical protein